MSAGLVRYVLAACVTLLGSQALAQATTVCIKISGTIVSFVDLTVPQRLEMGMVSGDLQGGWTLWFEGVTSTPEGASRIVGEGRIVLESGDYLRIRTEKTFLDGQTQDRITRVTEQVTIVGGTGRYRRASGSFESYGALDTTEQEGVRRYRGEVCTVAS